MSEGEDLTHRALAVPTRRRLFELLEQAPAARSVAELARELDVHENTVRLHLEVLIDAGLVRGETVRAPGGRGRPSVRYLAVGTDPSEAAAAYQRLASWLAEAVAPESAHALGRRLGASAAEASRGGQVDALVRLLGDEGFAPALETSGDTIVLHRCPFSAVAAIAPEAVCALHDGIVSGFAETMGAGGARLVVGDATNPVCTVRLGL
jgi:predicted ArsR family transcriptional regulator